MSESADEHEHEEADPRRAAERASSSRARSRTMLETIRQAKVAPLVLSTVSTLASVAYGKLEPKDLPEAKAAIDAIDALLPLLAGAGRRGHPARLRAGARRT